MRNIKLVLEYDGKAYHGFQFQPGIPTIQGEIERALNKLTGEGVRVAGAGRTDRGVHASGQTASFLTDSPIPIENFKRAFNDCLPEDIRVKAAEEVDQDFHARFSAKSREYVYTLYLGKEPPIFWRRYVWPVHGPLNLERIQEAGEHFLGTHDFSSFSLPEEDNKSRLRTVLRVEVKIQPTDLVKISIEANAFLTRMVRMMVGAMVEAGAGRISSERIRDILEAKDNRLAPKNVPASGLCLTNVRY